MKNRASRAVGAGAGASIARKKGGSRAAIACGAQDPVSGRSSGNPLRRLPANTRSGATLRCRTTSSLSDARCAGRGYFNWHMWSGFEELETATKASQSMGRSADGCIELAGGQNRLATIEAPTLLRSRRVLKSARSATPLRIERCVSQSAEVYRLGGAGISCIPVEGGEGARMRFVIRR